MDKMRIKINRLGAVTDSEITLRPLMIFMGESGLGKSYVAFLAHYVYAVLGSDRLAHYFDGYDFNELLQNVKSGDTILEIPMRDLFDWINKDAINYIGYLIGYDSFNGDVEINWPFADESIKFTYTEEIAGLSNAESVIYNISTNKFTYNILSDSSKINARVFETLIRAELSDAMFDEYINFADYILPPSRGALMELNERPAFRSGMYDEFFDLKAALVRPSKNKVEESKPLDSIIQKANNGKIAQSDNDITFTTTDGILMPLTAAASSVKELAPFVMMLNKFVLNKTSILFEEPEAHLHPERQRHVADLIGYAVSQNCHMQITTHSDYFIKRLNQLTRMYAIKERHPSESVDKTLSEIGILPQTLIDPARIGAYFLYRRNDGLTEIKELDVIESNTIPFTSFHNVIMDEFDISYRINEFEPEGENDQEEQE